MRVTMMEQRDTQELVERAKTGDRSAFDALAIRFQDRLRAAIAGQLVAHRRSDIDADDVLQETFLRAFESLDRFSWRGEDSLYPWLFGIARNVLLKQAEKARKNLALEIPERVAARGVPPSRAVRRKERFDRLASSLKRLKPEYREVLQLARLEGLTIKEIAERMNRTEYAVKHLMARAIRQMRESFGDTESLHLPPQSLEIEGSENEPG